MMLMGLQEDAWLHLFFKVIVRCNHLIGRSY